MRDRDEGPGRARCLILAASDGGGQKVRQLLADLRARHETAPPVVDSAANNDLM